jgi:hypothetical protein
MRHPVSTLLKDAVLLPRKGREQVRISLRGTEGVREVHEVTSLGEVAL